MKKTLVLIIAVAAMIIALPNAAKVNADGPEIPDPLPPIRINVS